MSQLQITDIFKILPHRSPFLLVDKVLEITPGTSPGRVGRKVKALKNVTFNEPFFPGHFPDQPVMPGVLILEAMAQVGAIGHHLDNDPEMTFLIAGLEKAKFKKPVVPGDTLIMTCEIVAEKSRMKKLSCIAYVDDQIVAEALIWAYASPTVKTTLKK
jgi:3-hydroxyacyl-[acyl-carrier-protein] dehydratase